MKTLPGDLTSSALDDDDCIAVELDLTAYAAGESLENMPDRMFVHLLACSLCLQTVLASMIRPRDAEWLMRRLHEEHECRGHASPDWFPAGRIH